MTVHQPTIKEIAYVGEETFFSAFELFNFSKNILTEEDKVHLEGLTNFDILIAILREQNAVMQKNRNCIELVLALLFPEYEIQLVKDGFIFKKDNEEHKLDNTNYEEFKSIVNAIFARDKKETTTFNPSGELAAKIAQKLQKRHQKISQDQAIKKIDILSRYISILAVGQRKDINSLLNYTVYQLFDEFKRFELKNGHDIYVQAKMAGAKDLKEVED